MNGSQPQRVALVTSGAVRLGRAISLGLVGAGYNLLVLYRSSEELARILREEVLAAGRRCEYGGFPKFFGCRLSDRPDL